mgnify:CR=1 FL=1
MLPSEVMRQVRRIQIRTSRMVNEFLSSSPISFSALIAEGSFKSIIFPT